MSEVANGAPANEDSILLSVKKVLGIDPAYDVFDQDLIMHINSTLGILNQLGVGPDTGFEISGSEALWEDFLGGAKHLNMVKSFMSMKVRLIFDPPATSFTIDAMKNLIAELEWRILAEELRNTSVIPVDGFFWDLTGGKDFPVEAPIGAYGIDTTTGNIWRKV